MAAAALSTLSCSPEHTELSFTHSTVTVTFGGDIEAAGKDATFSIRTSSPTDLYLGDSLITEYTTDGSCLPADSLVFGTVRNTDYSLRDILCIFSFQKITDEEHTESVSCRIKELTDGKLKTDTTITIKAMTPSGIDSLANGTGYIDSKRHTAIIRL